MGNLWSHNAGRNVNGKGGEENDWLSMGRRPIVERIFLNGDLRKK